MPKNYPLKYITSNTLSKASLVVHKTTNYYKPKFDDYSTPVALFNMLLQKLASLGMGRTPASP